MKLKDKDPVNKKQEHANDVLTVYVCVYLSVWTPSSLSPRTVPQYSPVWLYTSMVRASLMTSRRLMAEGEQGLHWSIRTQGEPSSVCSNSTGLTLRGIDQRLKKSHITDLLHSPPVS